MTVTPDSASEAARASALVVSEPERGVLLVTGSERASWLNGVITCDVVQTKPGVAAFGLLLSKVGKIQSDLYVAARGDALALAFASGTDEAARADLERMLVMEDAELVRPSVELACLTLHGPKAMELANGVAAGEAITAASLDRTGLGGALLVVPLTELERIQSELEARGAVLATSDAWQLLRVERRVGVFGIDYGPTDNPHEAALDRLAVSWTKGCYLGQEVVFMQDARGKLKRRLVQLEIDGARPAVGAPITDAQGEVVGEVTTASESALAGRPLALGRVRAPHHEPGVRLAAGGAPAVVRADPV